MIDFDIAKTLHKEFALHLEYFVHGIEESQLNPETVLDDKKCHLGKWLQGSGLRYSSLPAYVDLIRKHQHFHQVASLLITEYRAGDKANIQRIELTSLR